MRFVRKYRKFVIAAAIFLLCLLVFYGYWHLQVASAQNKSRSLYLNDNQQAVTALLEPGGVFRQSFSCNAPFHALGLAPIYSGALSGVLVLELYDGDGETLLGRVEGDAAETLPGTYATFVFPRDIHAEGGQYRLDLSFLPGEGSAELALGKSPTALPGWQLAENGAAAEGSLALMAATDRIGGFLGAFYWAFALLGSAFLAGLYLLFCFGVKTHLLFVTAALGLCLLFSMILPPYAAPDEEYHINQSFTISSFFLGQSEYKPAWGATVRRASDQNALIQDKNTTVYTYREFANNLFTASANSTPTTYSEEGVDGYRIPYWPVAAVLTLCRLLGLGFVPTLFVGRFASIAIYVTLVSFAIKITPTGKSIFAAVGLLPMSLHLAASFSRDSIIIAAYLFFTALCFYYIVKKPALNGKDLLVITLIVTVVSRAKIIYAPVMLLFLLIPRQKFTLRGKALCRRWVLFVKTGLVLLTFAHLYITLWQVVRMVAWDVLSRLYDGSAALALGYPAGAPPLFAMASASAPDAPFIIWDFFLRPGTIFWLLVRTLFTQFTYYLQTLVGGILSYYSLPLNWGFVIVLLALLGIAAVPEPGSPLLRRNQRLFGLCATLGVLLQLVVGNVLWTPSNYTTVYGIQGRYLLPVLPLALCAASGLWGWLVKKRETTRPLILAFSGVGVFALLNAFLLILQR